LNVTSFNYWVDKGYSDEEAISKINELYKTLTSLKINDAKQEPTNNILNKVIEYIIVGVIGAGLVILFK